MTLSISASPCTKAQFFDQIKNGFVPKNPIRFSLKYIQDVFANFQVQQHALKNNNSDIHIGEIGANHSRVLPSLAKISRNLYAIDVYDQSIGGGYTTKPECEGYQIIECLVGASEGLIKEETFDILFSVSVIENVQNEIWENFWIDHMRILKKGGIAIHLVDFYCNQDGPLPGVINRIYRSLGKFDETFIYNQKDWRFEPSWCSNDDYTMFLWNKSFPMLESVRTTHQCCSMVLVIEK